MNRDGAIARVRIAAPGVERNPQAALDSPGGFVRAGMPVLVPVCELGGDLELLAIILGECGVGRQVRVLHQQLDRVHVEFGG